MTLEVNRERERERERDREREFVCGMLFGGINGWYQKLMSIS